MQGWVNIQIWTYKFFSVCPSKQSHTDIIQEAVRIWIDMRLRTIQINSNRSLRKISEFNISKSSKQPTASMVMLSKSDLSEVRQDLCHSVWLKVIAEQPNNQFQLIHEPLHSSAFHKMDISHTVIFTYHSFCRILLLRWEILYIMWEKSYYRR